MPKLGRRSEITELDYQTSQAVTSRDAPFGTDYTPMLKGRIVASRYVHDIDGRSRGQNSPRFDKLALVSEKPNNVDPRTLSDFARRYNKPYLLQTHGLVTDHNQYAQDPFSQPKVVGRPTNLISKRPDSKDISSRYPQLPPIDGNRLRNNQISTVFEPEPWTSQFRRGGDDSQEAWGSPRRPFNSSEDDRTNGMRPLYDPKRGPGSFEQRPMYSQPAMNGGVLDSGDAEMPAKPEPLSRKELVKKLTALLPKNVFLPDHPITYAEADEVRLLQIIGEDMAGHSALKLRDIYLDIANTHDKGLTGYCQYQDLYHSLNRQMFNMPGDLLQLAAAMFVSTDSLSRQVNYEKFLSFIGLALKFAPKQSKSTDDSQQIKSPVSHQSEIFFSDSEQAKLVSMVEQQLSENDYVIDFSRLETDMLRADRMGRNKLDHRTIMDVCYQQNIPLQSSVLNRILHKCRYTNHDDLYNWRMFIEFLAKANPGQPRPVPVQLRNPSPPPPPARRSPSPSPAHNGRPITPIWRRHDPPQDPRVAAPQRHHSYEGPRDEQLLSRQDQVISRLENDIRQLERDYGDIKEMIRPHKSDTPWFKNFMEFATALYNQDQRFEGDLPAEDVFRWTRLYNESGNLGFNDYDISKALSDASKGGKVNIHTYLARLGNVANHDKIV